MATPITHIVLADKIFTSYFKPQDYTNFMIGTLFPDIRYVAGISRNITHYINPTILDAQRSDPFKAGMIIHNLLDIIREDYISKEGIYKIVEPNPLNIGAIKILEDILIYDQFSEWSKLRDIFENVLTEEKEFGVPEDIIIKWHKGLIEYLSVKPNHTTLVNFAKLVGANEEQASQLDAAVLDLSKNNKICEILQNFHKTFPDLLTLSR